MTLGEELHALEAQIDKITERPLEAVPASVRTILRSISGLLMAARWLAEDAVTLIGARHD